MNKRINVTRPSIPPYHEYEKEIKELWETYWLTNNGTKHKRLTEELKNFLDTRNITLFANGHLALESILEAMDLHGEVITTPFTFASTTHAIVRKGLTPVFCDINPFDYTIDADKIEPLITKKTMAILPVHVYGSICDYKKIDALANKYHLKVIYDAAHAFGETVDGFNVSNLGDASIFSFHATKIFNTIEGGAATYKDDGLVEKMRLLKNFGIMDSENVDYVGGNAKMSEFHAAMGICNLKHFNEEMQKRKSVVLHYRKRLDGVHGIRLYQEQEGVVANYSHFPVVFDDYIYNRDEICDKLARKNIFARKYFYPLTNAYKCYHYDSNKTPIAKEVASKVLTLPLYAGLGTEDVDRICDTILFP